MLCWEIVSGQDITQLEPLAMSRQLQGAQVGLAVDKQVWSIVSSGLHLWPGCWAGTFHASVQRRKLVPTGAPSQPACAAQGDQPANASTRVAMPPDAPPLARLIFQSCTQLDPALRPNAAQLVEWLRSGS